MYLTLPHEEFKNPNMTLSHYNFPFKGDDQVGRECPEWLRAANFYSLHIFDWFYQDFSSSKLLSSQQF